TSLVVGDATANTSGIFNLNDLNQTVASLSSAGTGTANKVVNLGTGSSSVFTVNLASGNATYGGQLGGGASGNGFSFTKDGAGKLTLSGANTYTGPTLISNGTLALMSSGTISSNVSVAAGAHFDVSDFGGTGFTIVSGKTLSGNGTV